MTDAPLEWALPEGLQVPKDELRLRLDFYDGTLLMHRYEGGTTTTHQVSPDDVAAALTRDLAVSSGLLPPNTLWWKNSRNGPLVALWVAPKVRAVAMQDKPFEPPTRLRVPMPGAIFVCAPGQPPWVYAVKSRPRAATDTVYSFPAFNVFSHGRVCPGTHQFGQSLPNIPDEFFISYFSHTGDFAGRSTKHPKDLRALWEELNGKTQFPTSDLVRAGTVSDVMELPNESSRVFA